MRHVNFWSLYPSVPLSRRQVDMLVQVLSKGRDDENAHYWASRRARAATLNAMMTRTRSNPEHGQQPISDNVLGISSWTNFQPFRHHVSTSRA